MGKDNRRSNEGDEDDYNKLQRLAELLRGIKPKQRNKFHERKGNREPNLKDVANEYNRSGEVEETD